MSHSKESKNICRYINKIAQIQDRKLSGINNIKRYAFFPILDEKAYEFYLKQEAHHWTENELKFTDDLPHYDQASPRMIKVFDTILAIFLSLDGVVSQIGNRFIMECKSFEEQAFYISQLHIELVHAATYGLAIMTFKRDADAVAELIEKAQNTPCVTKQIKFTEKWFLADKPKWQRYIASACTEGIFFCTLFAIIFWFRSKGLFPNFVSANESIIIDESIHRDWFLFQFGRAAGKILSKFTPGTTEYNNMAEEIKRTAIEIIREVVEIEDGFVDYILDEPLEDLNAKDLKTYARLISDNMLRQMSYDSIFKVKNPFTWMDDSSMQQKTNFYEITVMAYEKFSVTDALNWRKRTGLIKENPNIYSNPEEIDF